VMRDAQGKYDSIVCCGDLAGYGPDPNPVIDWARENLAAVVRGNHDRACAGLEDLDNFNPVARAACVWTASRLSPVNLDYLHQLPSGPLRVDGFELAHGSPFDEDEYLVTVADAIPVLSSLGAVPVFFGHTHLQGGFRWMHGKYELLDKPWPWESQIPLRLDPDAAWLVNPGSVGQPRDGDPRAAYCLFDSGSREALFCRVAYDYPATARKITERGLPDTLGSRLAVGR
jgi:diadenosine tetraphosphatase ApaH/serine/threonine PP2A family protein phosphatase